MSTNDQKVNIYLKKFLPQQQITANFLEYLRNLTLDVMADMYPVEGVFQGTDFSAGGSDKFNLSTPIIATDGLGHRVAPDPADVTQVPFENELAAIYYVGLRYNEVPIGTEVNVRTGEIEYTFVQEAIGELGEPTAITDNGSTLTINVDSVTQAGVTNAGRKVRVWLKQAVGQADAFYEGTVVWDGSNNLVEVPNLLGQDAGSVSTATADYQAFLIGPTVKRGVNLNNEPNVVFIGTVTGAGAGNPPATFDQSQRNLLITGSSVNDLNNEVKSFLVGGGLIEWDLDQEELTWADDLTVLIPHQGYNFTISAQTVSSLGDGECFYIELDAIGGVKPVTKVAIGSVPTNTNLYVVAIRHGNDIFFRNVLELQGDLASTTTGRIDGVTQDLLDYMGATDESDSDPNYPSVTGDPDDVLTQGDNLTLGMDKLHIAMRAINTNNPGESVAVADGIADTFTVPFDIDTDNTILDVEVFVDGRRQNLATDGVFDQPYKNYRKITINQVQLAAVPPVGKVVTIWKQGTAYGGMTPPTAGNLWSDPMDASQVPNVDAVHDIGSSSRRIREGWFDKVYTTSGIIEKTDLGEIKQIKVMISDHPALITQGTPLAKLANGKVVPADSDNEAKYIGIALEDIAIAGSGKVLIVGRNVPALLTGMGFAAGDDIYISETPGTPFTNDLGSFTGSDDDIIRVGIADVAENTSGGAATDLIMLEDVISRA